jgi:hypothetical protein
MYVFIFMKKDMRVIDMNSNGLLGVCYARR